MDYLITGADYLARFKDFKLVGRETEMSMLSSILVRKKASSAIVVGPNGVGSSAIILGLQAAKDDATASFDIVAKRLFWLDVDAMFSTGNGQDITVAFTAAMRRLRATANPVLIIEDAGDFYEACRNGGVSHFVNIINGAVKEGKMQVILETSDRDLPKLISWHSDFKETYTTLDVTEPVGNALREIVQIAAGKLSQHHSIKIDQEAIDTTVELTNKYRVDNGLGSTQPSRAIALLDRTFASYRLEAHKNPPHLKEIEASGNIVAYATALNEHNAKLERLRKLHYIQREGENAIASHLDKIESIKAHEKDNPIQRPEGVGFAAQISIGAESPEIKRSRDQIKMLEAGIEANMREFDALTDEINATLSLTRPIVLNEFSRITGISISKLGEDEKAILSGLEAGMKKKVVGQDHVVQQLADAIITSRVGGRNKDKPQAIFMFMGPSGTGKTYVAKMLAEGLMGDPKALLRFDMSEYMEKHSVAKLIGAPPGYEGFEAGGFLVNEMRKNRNRIILFDEIEKADKAVFDLMLQIFDDGRLTDNVGLVADFSESIIIMTTNIGQEHLLNEDLDFATASELTRDDLQEIYRPEFLNRIGGRENIVCFNRLSIDNVTNIVMREYKDLVDTYAGHNVEVVVSEDDIREFCVANYETRTGARGLPAMIVARLEPQVVKAILASETGRMEFKYLDGGFIRV